MSSQQRPRVIFERLELEGFGRHRALHLEIPAGLAVWVARNEFGKSTAVLGLIATLWGVPHIQELSGFTWERFRHLSGGPHRGRVTLRNREARFSVERSFDSHRVRVVAHEADGPRTIFDGEHNPNARTQGSPHLSWLREQLGLDDAQTVLDIFVVAQGDLNVAPHQVNEQTQALLVGAGGSTANQAIEWLKGRIHGLTRRRRGLSSHFTRDGVKDQQLDEAEQRLESLRTQLRDGAAQADRFVELQANAEAAKERERAAYSELDRLLQGATARRSWVEGRDAFARSNRRWRELSRAVTEARQLEAALAQARAVAAEVYPELEGVLSEGFEERAAAWLAAEGRVSDQRSRLEALQLQQATELEGLQGRLAEAQRLLAAAAEQPLEGLPLGPSGETLEVVHGAARRFLAALRSASAARDARQQALATLRELAPFANLEGAEREALRGSSEALRATAVRLEEAEGAFERAAKVLRDEAERFEVVSPLGPEAAAALISFERALNEPDPAEPGRLIGAVALLGSAVGVAWVVFEWPWWQALALGGGAALLWTLLWPRQPRLKRARKSLDQLALRQPSLSGSDAQRSDLAKLRTRYELRLEARAAEEGELEKLRKRLGEIAAEAQRIVERWSDLRESLIALGHDAEIDLEEALNRYLAAEQRADVAQRQLEAAAAAVGAPPPAPLPRLPSVAELGSDALHPEALAFEAGADARALIASLPHAGLHDALQVAELATLVGAIGEAEWAQWRAAAQREDATAEARRLCERLEEEERRLHEAHGGLMERETKALADLETALEETRAAALRGVPSSLSLTTPRLLRTAWAKREAQLRLVQAAEEGLRHHLRAVGAANVAALDELAAAAQLEALSAREAWQQVITHNPGLPPADLEADEDAERIRAAFERAEADASAARSAAEATRKAASEATEALARAQGSDPIDIAAVEVEIDEAQAELVRLELERDATALALDELSEASQLTFEGTARSLEVSSSERLRELSGVQGRRVEFDEEMRAFVIDGGGERLSVAQLSQGARDQLALAIRFALADLMAEQVALPMLLDDPFLNWDETRLAEAARALQSAATAGRQIWVLSHRPEFLAWGESVKVMPANG